LGATVFNVLLYIISFLLLLFIYSRFISAIPESAQQWGIIAVLLIPVAISFVVYRLVLKVVLKRIDVEKHFAPLFGSRRPQKPRD
jgi:uncharacterized membrane protein